MDEKKIREAIEAFQGQVDWLKRIDDKGCEESRRCCIEYFETAIEALEKQIAKKPVIYKGTNRADCPICGMTVRGIAKPFGGFCSKCGQRLDWCDSNA